MKCYRCGKEVHDVRHCPHCGALLKPTYKLLQAVQANDRDAIIQFYRMSAHLIACRIKEKGIEQENVLPLVNQAFKDLLKELPQLDALEQLDALRDAISDNVAYRYLVDHGQEVQELSATDVLLPIDDAVIKQLFTDLKNDEEKNQPKKNTFKSKMIVGVVVALILAVGGGAGGFYYHVSQKREKQRQNLRAYIDVAEDYKNAIIQISCDLENTYMKKQFYPTVFPAAKCVTNHSYIKFNAMDIPKLKVMMKDIDHNGQDEFILGYYKHKKTYVTGIYRYNDQKHVVESMNLQSNQKDYIDTLFTNKNLIIVKKKNNNIAYSIQDGKLKKKQSSIANVSAYLKKNHATVMTMKVYDLEYLIDLYNAVSKNKIYPTINQAFYGNVSLHKYDFDGDGQKDLLKVSYPFDSNVDPFDSYYETAYHISMNKVEYPVAEYNEEFSYFGLLTYIIRGENGAMFVLTGDKGSSDANIWHIYTYQNGQLKSLLKNTNMNYDITGDSSYLLNGTTVNKNILTIHELPNTQTLSCYAMDTSYKMSKGKLTPVSDEHKIYSAGFNSLDPYYMVLKTSSSFTTYQKAEGDEKSMVIPKGAKVRIVSVVIKNKYNAYKLLYRGKYGFIRINHPLESQANSDGNSSYNKYFTGLVFIG